MSTWCVDSHDGVRTRYQFSFSIPLMLKFCPYNADLTTDVCGLAVFWFGTINLMVDQLYRCRYIKQYGFIHKDLCAWLSKLDLCDNKSWELTFVLFVDPRSVILFPLCSRNNLFPFTSSTGINDTAVAEAFLPVFTSTTCNSGIIPFLWAPTFQYSWPCCP